MDLRKYGFSVTGIDDKKDEHKRNAKGKKEEYETKRKRKFQMSWLDDFPGLVHESDAENNIICRDNETTADKSCSMLALVLSGNFTGRVSRTRNAQRDSL